MRTTNRNRNPRRGASMLEFALGFLLFLSLIFAAFDLGGAVWTYTTVTHAAKQATRFATIHGAQNRVKDANGVDITDLKIKQIAKASAPGLDPTAMTVNVSWLPDNSRGSNVKVDVSYDHNFLAGALLGLGDNVKVKRSSCMLVIN